MISSFSATNFMQDPHEIRVDGESKLTLTDPKRIESLPHDFFKLLLDKTNSTITFVDSGIGMAKNELIFNMGTSANSGSKAFMEAMDAGGDVSMIGQLGVGFYSAYVVSDKVRVVIKNNVDALFVHSAERH